MIIKDLHSIINTDVEQLSETQVHVFKSDLIETLNAAEKTSKKKLFHRLDAVVSYIAGFGLLATGVNILYPLLCFGHLDMDAKSIAIGVISVASVITTACLKRISENKYRKIRGICNDKLMEVDRRIASLQFLDSLKQAHVAMADSTEVTNVRQG